MRKTKNVMKGLTAKEEEIMGFFWEKGPLFVKEMLAFYEEPKPHFNTLSTIVRGLEDKGFLSHHTYGNTYQYYAVVSEEELRKRSVVSGEGRGYIPGRTEAVDTRRGKGKGLRLLRL